MSRLFGENLGFFPQVLPIRRRINRLFIVQTQSAMEYTLEFFFVTKWQNMVTIGN